VSTRVQLAGLGALSPAGLGAGTLWRALFAPPPAPAPLAVPGSLVPGDSWRHGYALPPEARPPVPCFDELAERALAEALADARQRGFQLDGARIGLAVGSAAGDAEGAERLRQQGQAAPFDFCSPHRAADSLPERLAARLSLNLEGPCFGIANACAASLYALAHATDLIEQGEADAMLVLGIELLSRVTQAGFQKMTALDPERCLPFDARRRGTVLGEGAAALLLVSGTRVPAPKSLGAYCHVLGYGLSCDAHHPTAPQPEGREVQAAVARALAAADCEAAQIAFVVPHGTGTPLNDRIEAEVLSTVAGERIREWGVLPIKSHLGHSAGASGAFSVLAAALALEARVLPPALHLQQADPAVALRLPDRATPLPAALPLLALVNAYGFGGNNVSVVLERAAA